jgi:hypothetical protein
MKSGILFITTTIQNSHEAHSFSSNEDFSDGVDPAEVLI